MFYNDMFYNNRNNIIFVFISHNITRLFLLELVFCSRQRVDAWRQLGLFVRQSIFRTKKNDLLEMVYLPSTCLRIRVKLYVYVQCDEMTNNAWKRITDHGEFWGVYVYTRKKLSLKTRYLNWFSNLKLTIHSMFQF